MITKCFRALFVAPELEQETIKLAKEAREATSEVKKAAAAARKAAEQATPELWAFVLLAILAMSGFGLLFAGFVLGSCEEAEEPRSDEE